MSHQAGEPCELPSIEGFPVHTIFTCGSCSKKWKLMDPGSWSSFGVGQDAARGWETKDSGKRAVFESGMHVDTEEGKVRLDLLVASKIPFEDQFLTRCAGVMTRGADKYNESYVERNWEKACTDEELARMRSSAMRHFMQWVAGEDDEDHAAATFFNMLAYESTKYKMDNGIEPGSS